MNLSSQKKISQTRSPRVQIVYDVDVSGEAKSVELPFVMGVMGDFSGDNANALPPVSERRFHELDIHHFDQFMADIAPQVSVKVPNELSGNGLCFAGCIRRPKHCQMTLENGFSNLFSQAARWNGWSPQKKTKTHLI